MNKLLNLLQAAFPVSTGINRVQGPNEAGFDRIPRKHGDQPDSTRA